MLLRELEIDEHVLTLNDENGMFIIDIEGNDGEKLFSREYQGYEEVREILDLIVKEYEGEGINIKRVLDILETNK
jgi:hypothetical protein